MFYTVVCIILSAIVVVDFLGELLKSKVDRAELLIRSIELFVVICLFANAVR